MTDVQVALFYIALGAFALMALVALVASVLNYYDPQACRQRDLYRRMNDRAVRLTRMRNGR